MNIVDVLIAFSAFIAVTHGWRLGIIRGVFGLLGLFAGVWLALKTVPLAVDAISVSTLWRIVSGIGLIATIAMVGESVGFMLGGLIRRSLTWSPIRIIDSALGSAFRVTSLAVIIWLLTSSLAVLPDRGVLHQVRTSGIVSILDAYAPDAADRATATLRTAMQNARFPVVFADVTPQPQHTVAPADPNVISDVEVRSSYASVFKVEAEADSCLQRMAGSGFVFAPGRIMTNAHVVAGADRVSVWSMGDDIRRLARIVYFDPKLDVAVLAVEGITARPLEFGADAQMGMEAVVPGFTGGDPLSPDPARVSDTIIARGHDIYGVSRVDREILVIRSQVAAGDSGAPVVDLDGNVLGMVFAAGTDVLDTGYALTVPAIGKAAMAGRDATQAVPAGRCVD